jgi:hypothetical protein
MCVDCDWEGTIEQIEDMEADSDYDFAADTLDGIKAWVKENSHVTENQKRAVNNIEASKR